MACTLVEDRQLKQFLDQGLSMEEALKRYHTKVLPHDMCQPMLLCLIEEVIFNANSKMQFEHFYRAAGQNAGKYFDWPGGDAVATCPGTGEAIQPDRKRRHLLVAHQMWGSYMHDSSLSQLSRIIPRILTMEGFEKLMGTPAENRRLKFTVNARDMAKEKSLDVYPEFLRAMTSNGNDVNAAMRLAFTSKTKQPKKLKNANDAWQDFHDSGRYLAFERAMENKTKLVSEQINSGGGSIPVIW
jgi:hypothetical protein